MATRPARLLLEQGGWLLLEQGGYLLLDGYPDVEIPDAGDGWVATRPRRRPDPDNIDDLAEALLAALLLTV